jgi:hypothetical protein
VPRPLVPSRAPRSNYISYEYTETAFKDKMGAFVGSTFGELASWTAFSKYSRLLSATGGATLPLSGSAEGAGRPSGVPAGSRCEHAHGCTALVPGGWLCYLWHTHTNTNTNTNSNTEHFIHCLTPWVQSDKCKCK